MACDGWRIEVAEPFGADLDALVAWRLENVGPTSAAQLLDAYDALMPAIARFPFAGGKVNGTPYRWRPLEGNVIVYLTDERRHVATLMRLFCLSSNWRSKLFEGLDARP